jgi:hypothetical protein
MIDNPTKVTLYLPGDTIERGKKFAKDHNRSFSHLVTELVEEKVGMNVREVVELTPELQKKLKAKAKAKRISVARLIPALLNDRLGS